MLELELSVRLVYDQITTQASICAIHLLGNRQVVEADGVQTVAEKSEIVSAAGLV